MIVASDGLLTLGGDEIATLIHDHADGSPEALVGALLAAVEAEQEPNQDNTTIAAVLVVAATEVFDDAARGDEPSSVPSAIQPASEVLPTTRILERRSKSAPVEREMGRAAHAKAARPSSGNTMTIALIMVAAAFLAGAVWFLTGG